MQARKLLTNASYFAFTATPKNKTLEMFGQPLPPDAEGKVRILLIQYSYTSEGKDDGFNPYTITADFESGEKSVDVTLDQSYQDLTIEGEEESDMGAILAVVGVLVIILLIVAAVVVMRRRK